MEPLFLYGCRHDILGHYLKAIGLLRVLSLCADETHRDQDAEGWWDLEKACFCLLSPKYPTKEKLVEFFANHYQPTPFFSPWNTGGGLNEKKEIEFSISQAGWQEFWTNNRDAVLPLIANEEKRAIAHGGLKLESEPIKLVLSGPVQEWVSHPDIAVFSEASKGKKPKHFVEFSWSETAKATFFEYLSHHRPILERIIKFTEQIKKKFVPGKAVLSFDVMNEDAVAALPSVPSVSRDIKTKVSGKKAVMAILANRPENSPALNTALKLGRDYFDPFQEDGADERHLLEDLRDKLPSATTEALDAVFTTRVSERPQDSPLFLNRGDAGQAEVFRTFWVNFLEAAGSFEEFVEHGLVGTLSPQAPSKDGKGTPFFPDAIKAYNIGSSWVTEKYPFNALDYILAVEGGFAMRGSVGRTLAANSKRFAAFPFVFDSGDNMVDDANEVKGTARALWFPLWNRPVTFVELSSFITDAQARLPGKDARFSAEFLRALHSQGVDAGFVGWQEFRFKMLISRVPWVTSGNYVESAFRDDATRLNRALHPLDESHFLDQFEIAWKGNKAAARSPHPVRTEINAAMETAIQETTPHHCLDLLSAVFRACRQMAISQSFCNTLPGKRAHFFRSLPMEDWNALFAKFEQPEFRIARAVASIVGQMKQQDGTYSKTLPTFGSILPLNLGPTGWYLATKGDRSHQAVWTGAELCHDLAAVLGRRYMDSLKDDRPALVSSFGAPLGDVLAFLRGQLDDHLIARWIEALSLIGWRLVKVEEDAPGEEEWEPDAIPPEYAAFRTVLELECERREDGDRKKRRSQQPISLLCQRSTSTLPLAVTEALRWIAVWGVPNPYVNKAEAEKKHLSGRDIISLPTATLSFTTDAARLAAAVCIPLHWRERYALFRAVSLPQAD